MSGHADHPSQPETLANEICRWLQQFNGDENPFVYDKVVSFRNAKHRNNCRPFMFDEDLGNRATVSGFIETYHRARNVWIAFFSVETENEVGITAVEYSRAPWHCFAVAFVQDRDSRRHLVIYDVDPDKAAKVDNPRAKDIFRGVQATLYNNARKRFKSFQLWYSIDDSFTGKGECLVRSLDKIREWVALGDALWQGDNDPRAEGCKLIVKP